MARIELDVDTTLAPETVFAALIDFSDRRPDIWPGLASEFYEVYSVGETTADVKEGTIKPIKVWAREHYDWSTPGKVSWTVQESNFSSPGDNVVATITPRDGGGSNVHVAWSRTGATRTGRFIVWFMTATKGKLIAQSMRAAFGKLEQDPSV